MLMIRLARFGAKKKPTYRLVVIDKERARNSRAVEVVGHYNPVAKPKQIHIEHDRVAHWLKNGAQPSDTVKSLLEKHPAAAGDQQPAA
jgi:small subunit ribosomal protein S16